MADTQPSGTSTTEPAVATPIKNLSLEEGEPVKGEEEESEEVKATDVHNVQECAPPHERGNAVEPRASHDAPQAKRHSAGDNGGPEPCVADHPSSLRMDSISGHDPASHTDDDATSLAHESPPARTSPPPSHSSTEPNTSAQPQPQAPLKRFTSVNISKRFLEKTSSTSGASGPRRGPSPGSRSPSTDRPASSRLVTTKLTAVAQPSAASTSGWLRSTPGASATPTPSPSSPQPSANDASTVSPAAAPTLQQSLKRRPAWYKAGMG
ncbi:hypothetical protein JB92DRAFT_140639 [Gautieria morchelliformis]|nr:hypothetical protein JB92DRAFT_140639 [Gautieria morchelliformis]